MKSGPAAIIDKGDPRESKNLAKSPGLKSVIAEIKKLLRAGPVAKESPIRAAKVLDPAASP